MKSIAVRTLPLICFLFLAGLIETSCPAQSSPNKLFSLISLTGCVTPGSDVTVNAQCAQQGVALLDFLSFQHIYTLPADTISGTTVNSVTGQYSFSSWFQPSSTAATVLSGLPAIPTSNTTIKMVVIAQTNPNPNVYTHLLSATQNGDSNNALFSIGQHGTDWIYGRLIDSPTAAKGYWMTPWEPTDHYSAQSSVLEDVYYTFIPDGRLRIDVLTPYTRTDGTTGFVWEESIQDGGWPLSNLAGETGSPLALPFRLAGPLAIGNVPETAGQPSIYGRASISMEPTSSSAKIVSITAWDQPLTPDQIDTDANSDHTSTYLTLPRKPCNTGGWMGTLVGDTPGTTAYPTPCGIAAEGQDPPSPPASILPMADAVSHKPRNFGTPSTSATSLTFQWSAPADIIPSSYIFNLYAPDGTVVYSNSGASSPANAINITGLLSDQTYYASVEAQYSSPSVTNVYFDDTAFATGHTNPVYFPDPQGIGYFQCATENGICHLPAGGPYGVLFGINGSYVYRALSGDVLCAKSSFDNIDPDYRIVKVCYRMDPTYGAPDVNGLPSDFHYCAPEHGTCTIPAGGATVYYGIVGGGTGLGTYTTVGPKQTTIVCSNDDVNNPFDFIGDPAPQQLKKCSFKPNSELTGAPTLADAGISAPYASFCARDGQNCYFSGWAAVLFGSPGHWTKHLIANGVPCNANYLWNPGGTNQGCWYVGLTTKPGKYLSYLGATYGFAADSAPFTLKSNMIGLYGVDNRWSGSSNSTQYDILSNCPTPGRFSDPAPGVSKFCYNLTW